MAAPYNPPAKGEDFLIGIGLEDTANPGKLKANPTIAAGDFKVSKDFGTFTNLNTLPSVAPASGVQVKITLSATEMDADVVTVACIDASGAEWADLQFSIPTTAA